MPPTVNTDESTAVQFNQQGEIYLSQGKLEEAIASCEQALKIYPNFAPAYKTLGNALQAQGRMEEARHWYAKAIEIGELLQAQNDLDGAMVAYQRAVAVRPNLVKAHDAIGKIQLEKRDFLGAIITFRRVTQLDPDNGEAYYNLGTALQARDRRLEAIQAFQQSLDTYRQQGNNEGAQKAEKALQGLK